MYRGLFTVMSLSSVCLAMVLATVAVLAVPEHAFAAPDCPGECALTYGTGTAKYYGCLGECCYTQCNGDPECEATCCSDNCPDQTCKDGCNASALGPCTWCFCSA